ncbi:hypothetical protein COCHEDRAFT_1117733, partial [Bipolaris maydis C5]
PPYSPDINPIKNFKSILKDRLNNRKTSSLGIRYNSKSIKTFKRAIFEEWQAIPQQAIDNCILSLPNRFRKVVDAKG